MLAHEVIQACTVLSFFGGKFRLHGCTQLVAGALKFEVELGREVSKFSVPLGIAVKCCLHFHGECLTFAGHSSGDLFTGPRVNVLLNYLVSKQGVSVFSELPAEPLCPLAQVRLEFKEAAAKVFRGEVQVPSHDEICNNVHEGVAHVDPPLFNVLMYLCRHFINECVPQSPLGDCGLEVNRGVHVIVVRGHWDPG